MLKAFTHPKFIRLGICVVVKVSGANWCLEFFGKLNYGFDTSCHDHAAT